MSVVLHMVLRGNIPDDQKLVHVYVANDLEGSFVLLDRRNPPQMAKQAVVFDGNNCTNCCPAWNIVNELTVAIMVVA